MAELYRHTDFYGDSLIFALNDVGEVEATVSREPEVEYPFVFLDEEAGRRLIAALQQHYDTERGRP